MVASVVGCARCRVAWTAGLLYLVVCPTAAKPAWFPATLPKANAHMQMEFPYPFEVVKRTWENGPPDPQFIREDVQEKKSGYEVVKMKTIYTKNPFPYLIQKTLIREPELVFLEEERVNMKQKIVQYWSVNKCLDYVGKAYRTSTIRAHPTKPGYTLIEQAGGVEVTSKVPGALKGPVENFACGAFIDVCKQALDKLNVTLRRAAQSAAATAAETEETLAGQPADGTTTGALQGLGLVLGGLCCKFLLASPRRPALRSSAAAGTEDPDAVKALEAGPKPGAARPPSARHTPPFRAAAAAFAVALFSTQLL